MRQTLLSAEFEERNDHGGELWKGRRKKPRPIAAKRSMHIVLRSSHAVGAWSFLSPRHAPFVRALVPLLAKRFGVVVYESANVGNHIHLLVRPRSRDSLKHFLMSLAGRIAMRVTGARRGKPFGKRFFDAIPWSRIVEWGKGFRAARAYVVLNASEAAGLVPFRPRRTSSVKREIPRLRRGPDS